MLNFSIRELRALSPDVDKNDGVVRFTDGFNLIRGRSNTGKTWILKSIYYLFGSDSTPIPTKTGYTAVIGKFDTTLFGEVTIRRSIGEKTAYVTSSNPDIKNGDYYTDYNGAGPLYLSDLWARILGWDKGIMIPKNEKYVRVHLAWTTIVTAFFVDEDEVDGAKSIIVKDSITGTPLVAGLYYLLTNNWQKGISVILDDTSRQATESYLKDYINKQREHLLSEQSKYIETLDAYGDISIDTEIQRIQEDSDAAQEMIDRLIDEDAMAAEEISRIQNRIIECQVLINRYESLLSQYKADLKRMDFILKGESAITDLPINEICPFCGGDVHENMESYTKAVQAETARIVSEIQVIVSTENDVVHDKDSLEDQLQQLLDRRKNIQKRLSKQKESLNSLSETIYAFTERKSLDSKVKYIDNQLSELDEKEGNLGKSLKPAKKSSSTSKFKPKKLMESHVGAGFADSLNDILTECNFTSGKASWDFTNFDILIDGDPKGEDWGKGYRSFLNSVVGLMFYTYFNSDSAVHKPGFLMIDTPLLGFDEVPNKKAMTQMQIGLYNYFLNHPGEGQIIVVDNLNNLPNIDFEKRGANVITYYKDEEPGHTYGFLPGWRNDLEKEEK